MFSCEYWKIFKSTYFEEDLRMAASEMNLGSGYLGLFSGELFSKPSWLSIITKIPFTFKPEL